METQLHHELVPNSAFSSQRNTASSNLCPGGQRLQQLLRASELARQWTLYEGGARRQQEGLIYVSLDKSFPLLWVSPSGCQFLPCNGGGSCNLVPLSGPHKELFAVWRGRDSKWNDKCKVTAQYMEEESGSRKCSQSISIMRTWVPTAQVTQSTSLGFPILTCRTVDAPEIKEKHYLIWEDEMHLKEKELHQRGLGHGNHVPDCSPATSSKDPGKQGHWILSAGKAIRSHQSQLKHRQAVELPRVPQWVSSRARNWAWPVPGRLPWWLRW